MRDLVRRQARLGDGVLQGDMGIGRGIAHEAQLLAVDARFQVDVGHARHLAAHAQLGELRHGTDARAALAQRGLHGGEVVADAGNDARAGDDDTLSHAHAPASSRAGAAAAASSFFEQAHAQVGGHVDFLAVGQEARIADRHDQLALDDALDVDFVGHELDVGPHLAGELDLARTQCAPPARQLQPGQVETDELPHRVQAQAARHDRIALEVAVEEPEIRPHVQFGANPPQPVRAAVGGRCA